MTQINTGGIEATRQKITEKFVIDADGKIMQEVPKRNLDAKKAMFQKRIENIEGQIAVLQAEKEKIVADIAELNTFISNVDIAIAAKEPK